MHSNRAVSSIVKTIVAIVVIIVVVLAGFLLWTYPRDVVSFPVSLAVGASAQQESFEVPVFDSAVQVQVSISSGASLWQASITDIDGDIIWSDQAPQVGQTTYNSDWLALSSGSYNFSFGTLGGALEARVTVKAKGAFW